MDWNDTTDDPDMTPRRKILVRYALLLAASVVYTLLWYRGEGLTIGGDYVLPYNGLSVAARYTSYWNLWKDLGNPIPPLLTDTPPVETLTMGILLALTNSPTLTNKVFILIFTAVETTSTFYLTTVLLSNHQHKYPVAFVVSAIALYNPLKISSGYLTIVEPLVPRAFLPLFLALAIDGFKQRRISFAFIAGLTSIPLLELFPIRTWQLSILASAALILYVLFSILFRKLGKPELRFSALYFGCVLLASAIVNLHNVILLLASFDAFKSTAISFQPNFFFNDQATVFNVLRLLPLWGFYNGFVPYANVYSQPFLVLITLVFPIVSFSSIILSRSRSILCLVTTAALVVFLSAATNPPLGFVYRGAVTTLLPLKVFYNSEPTIQFALPISLALPAGYTVIEIQKRLERRLRRWKYSFSRATSISAAALVLILIVVSSWPLLTGDIMSYWYHPSSQGVQIPNDYLAIRQASLKTQCFCWTLLLPRPSTWIGATWGYQGTVLFYNSLLDGPLITGKSVSYAVGQEGVAQALNFIYKIPVRIVPNPDTTNILGAPNSVAWTTYDNDTMKVVAGGPHPYSNSSVIWSLRSGATDALHVVAYPLSVASDITPLEVVLLARGSFNIDQLQFGLGDESGNIGWYRVGAQQDLSGWTTFIADPRIPQFGHFNAMKTSNLFLRYFASAGQRAEIQIGAVVVGRGIPDGYIWARTLAAFSVGYILLDKSMNLDNLTNSQDYLGSLSNETIFERVFHGPSVDLFHNRYLTGSMLIGATRVYTVSTTADIYGVMAQNDLLNSSTALVLRQDALGLTQGLIASTNQTSELPRVQQLTINRMQVSFSIFTAGPTLLVFNQAYDDAWTAYLNGIRVLNHIKTSGFSNGWIIDAVGKNRVDISFSRQPVIEMALLAAILGIVTVSSIAVLSESRYRKVTSKLRKIGL